MPIQTRSHISYRNGTKRPDLQKSYKSVADIVPATPCFYVVKPILCKQMYIKIGKSLNGKYRMKHYSDVYTGKFNIIHYREFRKTNDGENIDGLSNFSAKFETQIKRKLKEMNITPIGGDEYYDVKHEKAILKAVLDVDEENNKMTEEVKKNRKSQRIKQ